MVDPNTTSVPWFEDFLVEMSTPMWPALNACLNAVSGILIVAGWVLIRSGKREAHRRCMMAACGVSTGFLASYLAYHALHGSTPYQGTGGMRVAYFSILISHTVLATAVVPLVVMTLRKALAGDFSSHRKWARWTFPLWLYVSVTGVVVYGMLYG